MRRLVLALVMLVTSCLDFDEAEKHYCATHPDFCTLDAGVRSDGG